MGQTVTVEIREDWHKLKAAFADCQNDLGDCQAAQQGQQGNGLPGVNEIPGGNGIPGENQNTG